MKIRKILLAIAALLPLAAFAGETNNVTTATEVEEISCTRGHLDVYAHGTWGSATVTVEFQDQAGTWAPVAEASWTLSGSETVAHTVNCIRRSGQLYRVAITGSGHDLTIGLWADYE